jgi:hypothetical protein
MIIPFCDSEYQTIAIGLTVGTLGGMTSVATQSMFFGVLIAVVVAIGAEIAVHEYREDEQYVKAKKQVQSKFGEISE